MNFKPMTKTLLAMHEVFRRLGFTSEQIFVMPVGTQMFIRLRQEGREFDFKCGDLLPHEVRSVLTEWPDAVAWWNAKGAQEAKREIYEATLAFLDGFGLTIALAAKDMQFTIDSGKNLTQYDA